MMQSSNRYGGNWPDPATACGGDCEGMGTVPVQRDDTQERYRTDWLVCELLNPSKDGFHFVTCLQCNGTGRKPA